MKQIIVLLIIGILISGCRLRGRHKGRRGFALQQQQQQQMQINHIDSTNRNTTYIG